MRESLFSPWGGGGEEGGCPPTTTNANTAAIDP